MATVWFESLLSIAGDEATLLFYAVTERMTPCRVRDWKMFFDPTLIFRELSLVLVCTFWFYRKA